MSEEAGWLRDCIRIIEPQQNKDGTWKSVDFIEQLSAAVTDFEVTHEPNCCGLFVYDNSRNHDAYPDDALRANLMNKTPGGVGMLVRKAEHVQVLTERGVHFDKGKCKEEAYVAATNKELRNLRTDFREDPRDAGLLQKICDAPDVFEIRDIRDKLPAPVPAVLLRIKTTSRIKLVQSKRSFVGPSTSAYSFPSLILS